jgi:hypothetical protein
MLAPPLPGFIAAAYGRRISAPSVLRQRAGIREEPLPATCWECGRVLTPERRTFCCDECEVDYRRAMGKRRPVVDAAVSAVPERRPEPAVIRQSTVQALPKADRKALRRWYTEELQPRLSRMSPGEIEQGAVRRSYAYYIVAGTRIPHPRHYPNSPHLPASSCPRHLLRLCEPPDLLPILIRAGVRMGLRPRARKCSVPRNDWHSAETRR